MTPSQARVFYAVATEGSFTGAARRLSLSQPTVTNQVKQLERHYKIELFKRTSRGVRLTDVGEELLPIVHRMLGSHGEAVDLLRNCETLRRGRLRMGAYGPHDVTALVARFRTRYPDIEISIQFDGSARLAKLLLNHEIDVGLFWSSVCDDSFHIIPYERKAIIAIAPNAAPWSGMASITAAELSRHELVVREHGTVTRHMTDQLLAEHGMHKSHLIEISSQAGVIDAVGESLGLALVVDKGPFPADKVVKLPVKDRALSREMGVICLAERSTRPLIRAFLNTAREIAVVD